MRGKLRHEAHRLRFQFDSYCVDVHQVSLLDAGQRKIKTTDPGDEERKKDGKECESRRDRERRRAERLREPSFWLLLPLDARSTFQVAVKNELNEVRRMRRIPRLLGLFPPYFLTASLPSSSAHHHLRLLDITRHSVCPLSRSAPHAAAPQTRSECTYCTQHALTSSFPEVRKNRVPGNNTKKEVERGTAKKEDSITLLLLVRGAGRTFHFLVTKFQSSSSLSPFDLSSRLETVPVPASSIQSSFIQSPKSVHLLFNRGLLLLLLRLLTFLFLGRAESKREKSFEAVRTTSSDRGRY